ncbi:L-serine ammonia-lyase [Pseudanabaena sp. FACHB-2040]|uniref:L-serine ammonia-lyase n=1 Tax=Pseudanabaena sp. FACHB-2040 TaxID=2692859 RepID=UPI00168547DB|nr:L-serine ammonia-lyase [Pseudanabaena sp. FACHB-2040]MBD2258376.1 L-serine ammonia-lyase [Pseudanabaena sp. FACHB-2040]
MSISVFDIFKIGIGPSSSHTVGPMKAARRFAQGLATDGLLPQVKRLQIDLHGSLGATGRGHGSDRAALLGLEGEAPDCINPALVDGHLQRINRTGALWVLRQHAIAFHEKTDLLLHWRPLPYHPNGMVFTAFDNAGDRLRQRTYYSIGGGFVVDEHAACLDRRQLHHSPLPYPITSAHNLLNLCQRDRLSISQLMLANEQVWRSEAEIRAGLLRLWQVMQDCVERGCHTDGILPGGLKVKRRAAELYRQLKQRSDHALADPLSIMDWVNLYAMAVNEENAAGGRVVTAPTNGAAGIIPAILHYYSRFCPQASDDGIVRFLLVAGAIAILYQENASISGADVGCQGEVGVACSMAAGALTEVLGGTPEQVENAAEIGMEHNLGLTCDPVGGLVQVPCIERNAMGAIKAINAARMALKGDGQHCVHLDKVIKTMRDTGHDMHEKYKETSRGGLAVNVIEC